MPPRERGTLWSTSNSLNGKSPLQPLQRPSLLAEEDVLVLAVGAGTILLSPNEHRVAEDRPDCFWLYVVTNCAGEPVLQEPILNPARFE